ncbi:hypothetical protein MMC13_007201 [Lambiella insularis]|nr:hypothetical protein [Lambiella insularis]
MCSHYDPPQNQHTKIRQGCCIDAADEIDEHSWSEQSALALGQVLTQIGKTLNDVDLTLFGNFWISTTDHGTLGEHVEMEDKVEGVQASVGEVLSTMICRQRLADFPEVTDDMRDDIVTDLLCAVDDEKRYEFMLGERVTCEIPIRHVGHVEHLKGLSGSRHDDQHDQITQDDGVYESFESNATQGTSTYASWKPVHFDEMDLT